MRDEWFYVTYCHSCAVQRVLEYADRGNEGQVKELAGKTDVSFEEFAKAFQKRGSVRHCSQEVIFATNDALLCMRRDVLMLHMHCKQFSSCEAVMSLRY